MSESLITWPELTPGRLIRRYQRFLVDVHLDNGKPVTAHCPNSGSMRGCLEPGRRVYLSRSPNPKRNFPHTFEMIEMPGSLVVVNTLMANRLVKKALQEGLIPELSTYQSIRSEIPYGENSRIDLLLMGEGHTPCLVEVKSCTLVENGLVMFPDAVTQRGFKHLVELQREVKSSRRCVMFYLVQRTDGSSFAPAGHIDPGYARELRKAHAAGVEILVYTTRITLEGVGLGGKIPFCLEER